MSIHWIKDEQWHCEVRLFLCIRKMMFKGGWVTCLKFQAAGNYSWGKPARGTKLLCYAYSVLSFRRVKMSSDVFKLPGVEGTKGGGRHPFSRRESRDHRRGLLLNILQHKLQYGSVIGCRNSSPQGFSYLLKRMFQKKKTPQKRMFPPQPPTCKCSHLHFWESRSMCCSSTTDR